MSLAIFTALVGQVLALKYYSNHPLLTFFSLFSIALGAGAAGCINMWYDRDIDAIMKRTKNRPKIKHNENVLQHNKYHVRQYLNQN